MTRTTSARLALALTGLGLATARPAAATTQVFDLTYTGIHGSTATGTGTITINESLLNNPGITYSAAPPFPALDSEVKPFVTEFSLTIAGAAAGNGTFDLSDYDADGGYIVLDTYGGTLDLSRQLIGQPTYYGSGGFGSEYAGEFDFRPDGDPNSFGVTDAPEPLGNFQIRTDGGREGSGDLQLTSFTPAPPEASPAPKVPESGLLGLLGVGLCGLLLRARRRRLA